MISGAVKPGTPIAAAAGYPHARLNYTLVCIACLSCSLSITNSLKVKNVYYMSVSNRLSERQAPSNDSQAWKDDNFSGLYTGTESTHPAAHWNQNISNASQELVVLFQEDKFANGLTQARYTSNSTTSNPWVTNRFGFSLPKGSTFGTALVSYPEGRQFMLYIFADDMKLHQREYEVSTDLNSETIISLLSESSEYLVRFSMLYTSRNANTI